MVEFRAGFDKVTSNSYTALTFDMQFGDRSFFRRIGVRKFDFIDGKRVKYLDTLRKPTDQDINFFSKLAGKDALLYAFGESDEATFLLTPGLIPTLAFNKLGRVLFLSPYKEGQFNESPGIAFDFSTVQDFNRGLLSDYTARKFFVEKQNRRKTGEQLRSGTLEFLRFVGQTMLRVDPDRAIVIRPTTTRRERIAVNFLTSHGKTNFVVLDGYAEEDRKSNGLPTPSSAASEAPASEAPRKS